LPINLGSKTGTTTNDYGTLIEASIPPQVKTVSIQLKENNVNAIKYKVDGTIDGSTWEAIKAEATLAKNATIALTPSDTGLERLADPWMKIRVQHKASIADSQGNTTATIIGQ